MNIDIPNSISRCYKQLLKYSNGVQIKFDQIEDPEEREKAELLGEYLWWLEKVEENAKTHMKITISD